MTGLFHWLHLPWWLWLPAAVLVGAIEGTVKAVWAVFLEWLGQKNEN